MGDKLNLTAKDVIEGTKHWNGGVGLIVPPQVGKLLKQSGINEGYTVSKPVPFKEFEGITLKK